MTAHKVLLIRCKSTPQGQIRTAQPNEMIIEFCLSGGAADSHAMSASTKSEASKGARSSGPSPRPMNFTGTPSSRCTATTMPPLGVPVELVGLGEGADDLAPFDAEGFVDALLGD